MAMGHRVTKTQQYYGTKRQGKGGAMGLKGVRGTRTIKQTSSSPTKRIKATPAKQAAKPKVKPG